MILTSILTCQSLLSWYRMLPYLFFTIFSFIFLFVILMRITTTIISIIWFIKSWSSLYFKFWIVYLIIKYGIFLLSIISFQGILLLNEINGLIFYIHRIHIGNCWWIRLCLLSFHILILKDWIFISYGREEIMVIKGLKIFGFK